MMVDWLLGFTMLRWMSGENNEVDDDHRPTPNMSTSMMLVNHLGDKKIEIEKLKEEQRWRKWPEEKPIESGMYLVYTKWSGGKYCQRDCIVDIQFFYVNGEICDGGREWFTHWKPFAQPSSR
jgi:hypothetical protein